MRNDLMIPGIDRNGERVPALAVTGVGESAELPKEFALHGSYLNPLHPITIQPVGIVYSVCPKIQNIASICRFESV